MLKECDGCGEFYWQDPGGEYAGPHYTLIREEGSDEESGSAGATSETA